MQMATFSPNNNALYSQVAAAALSAQQRRLTAAASFSPSLAAGDPASQLLGKLLPQLPSLDASSSMMPISSADRCSNLLVERAIAAPKLLLCAFSAFVARTFDGTITERVDIVKIPQFADEPLEVRRRAKIGRFTDVSRLQTISFDSVKQKFPPVLANLFNAGPTPAFFLGIAGF